MLPSGGYRTGAAPAGAALSDRFREAEAPPQARRPPDAEGARVFRPALALAIPTALATLAVSAVSAVSGPAVPGLADPAYAEPSSQQAAATHDKVVSDNPVASTPHVLDGRVKAVARVGDTIVLGGEFTQVASPDRSQTYERTNLVAFDADTGAVREDFAPTTDDTVNALEPGPNGETVYVGGMFDDVNGTFSRGVARLDLSDGSATAGFSAPEINGRVKDILVRDGKLWMAGTFRYVNDQEQPALATLDAETGDLDDGNRLRFADPYRGGVLQVMNIEISNDGDTLVAAGNFGSIEGKSRPQAAVLELGADGPTLSDWQTDYFAGDCGRSYDSYMRGVGIDPTGKYVVFSTTGGWHGADSPCDTVTRFELKNSNGTAGLAPTWVDHSGGDTHDAVAVTNVAVYVGGHFRWQNNPNTPTGDDPGPGAMERSGIAALDPDNGVPYSWNPGRTLGVGVFDMLVTENGLWVASDTDRIGNWEFHGRIARFPLSGGTKPPAENTRKLPGVVHTRAVPDKDRVQLKTRITNPYAQASDSGLTRVARPYDGKTFGEERKATDGGLYWKAIRGAFTDGDRLFLAREGRPLLRMGFDGTNYTESTPLDAADQLVVDETWRDELNQVTGMTGVDGLIYYTLEGRAGLFSRGLNAESGAVSAGRARVDTGDVDFSNVAGMFATSEHLYWGSAEDGKLRRASFVDGRLDADSVRVVSDPKGDKLRWDARPTFLRPKGSA